jgi:carotenoid cleavage dioxygenase
MNRRNFLSSLGLGALALSPAAAHADGDTLRRFHSALARDRAVSVYADLAGAQSASATLQGRLPADLNGVFYRNGPGRFELGGERYHHWFDGDGFAQRWSIADGSVTHRGRYVETEKFIDESQAGRFLYPAFGTEIARRGFKNNDTVNAANTNLLPFNGRLYALWEGGSATELDPDTLATRGLVTWRHDLKAMPFSAHPKLDPAGGMWNFGAAPGTGRLFIYRIGAAGQLLQSGAVEVPQLALVHDFVVSAKHLIFLVPPYDISAAPGLSLAERHVWAGSGPAARPTRVVVVAKDTLAIRQVFELPPQMVFHFGNAYDDGDCTHFDVVLHPGDRMADLTAQMRGERLSNAVRSHATLVTLDYGARRSRSARLLDGCEFPRVMPQVASVRHRKLALTSSAPGKPYFVPDTVNLVDTDSGKTDSYSFGAGWQVEEHVLVPRRNARSETDGYLLGVAQDTGTGVSVLSVFDAARVGAGPLALAKLPYRTPVCFHGNFLSA